MFTPGKFYVKLLLSVTKCDVNIDSDGSVVARYISEDVASKNESWPRRVKNVRLFIFV